MPRPAPLDRPSLNQSASCRGKGHRRPDDEDDTELANETVSLIPASTRTPLESSKGPETAIRSTEELLGNRVLRPKEMGHGRRVVRGKLRSTEPLLV
jgi:hypothetical protein